jgi:hypothetical protein
MKMIKLLNREGIPEYHFVDYEKPEDFKKIENIIKKLKIKIIEKTRDFSYIMNKYLVNNSEIIFYNDHMIGNYLTVKSIKDIPNLDVMIEKLQLL